MAGDMTEEDFYDRLKKCLEEKQVKNTVVINNWKDNGYIRTEAEKKLPSAPKERATRENDFLIVSKPFRLIIHIEAKTSCTWGDQQKAAEQLSKGREFFKETIPFPQEKGWKYVRIMCFGNGTPIRRFNQDCQDCRKKYILGPDTDLSVWWDEITKDLKPEENLSKSDTYIDILKYLLHLMFKQEMCITDANLTEYTEEKIEAIFLSSNQFNVLHSMTKKVALTSFYGTGKTALLKSKILQTLERNKSQKVVVAVIEETKKDTILLREFRAIMQDSKLVIGLKNIGGNFFADFFFLSCNQLTNWNYLTQPILNVP